MTTTLERIGEALAPFWADASADALFRSMEAALAIAQASLPLAEPNTPGIADGLVCGFSSPLHSTFSSPSSSA
jgi:hypothetical protein